MLFIDTDHTYRQLQQELNLHADKVRKYIIMHDTQIYGRQGCDGLDKGLLDALEDFMSDHPGEWKIVFQTDISYGLTVIRRLENEQS